jgi:wobble nucleotide-excising tRNase
MLERIVEIQGIGLLHQANGTTHTCKKATLIYAENGRGKSTLATILRSASTGDAALLMKRKTVDGTVLPKVILQFGRGHRVSFETGVWSHKQSNILVFDADFIERNVHSGGSVDTNHRKHLLEFALGEAAVAARSSVEKTTNEARQATEKVAGLTTQLSTHHSGMNLPDFKKLPSVADADTQIEAIQKQISSAGNVTAILAKPLPSAPDEPTANLPDLFRQLGTALKDVHANAERIVKQHAAKLGSKVAESWLSQGSQFSDDEACPYCGQEIEGNNLIQAYQTHFNAAYVELKVRAASLHQSVQAFTNPHIVENFFRAVETARAHAMGWREQLQLQPIEFDVVLSRLSLAQLQTLLLNFCERKQANPAEPLGSVEDQQQAETLWLQVIKPMRTTNAAIQAANILIKTYKEKLTAGDVSQLQQSIERLRASKRRHETVVVDLLAQFDDAEKKKTECEAAKSKARKELDSLMTKTLNKYEKSINKLLKNFGASFTIKGMKANFHGAAPRSEYGLQLRNKEIALEEREGAPSFASALSEGDKRTLAFAFFVASTLEDPNLAKRVVVIDDPMCSLDLNRKAHTKSILKQLHSNAEQLMVLAHDAHFIRDLRDALQTKAEQPSLFQFVSCPRGYTDFEVLDIDKVCESAYLQHHRLLTECVTLRVNDLRAVAKAIRPMLEGYLHLRFPRCLDKSKMFGEAIAAINGAAITSPLHHAKNLVEELKQINEYAKQFHHDTNPTGADSVQTTETELQGFVKRSLDVVHKCAL